MIPLQKALEGRFAIVTGANQGLGFTIARTYLMSGVAGLCICARDSGLLDRASGELRACLQAGQKLIAHVADISNAADVRSLVDHVIKEFGRVDILVNNAGVYGPIGKIEDVDWAEWVRAVEINLHGSVLMCREVLPHFAARGRGKIVQLSGGGATNPLPRFSAYAVSKAAIVRFVETLAEEVKESGIDVNSIAPGALNTRMLESVLGAGPEKAGLSFYERSLKQKESGGASLDTAARLAVFLGSALSDGITGRLISAVWDPWSELPARLEELRASDIYTLRRIVPADRGRNWGESR